MQKMALHNSQIKKYIILSTLCTSLVLTACQKSEETVQAVETSPKSIELIPQDIVEVKTGSSNLSSAFSGTIRAVNQSSIQAQVSATASQVTAQVGQEVKKGQILVRLNNQDNAARLAQSKANLAAAQAQAQQAANMVNRKKRLYDQGFISKVEYEQSQVEHKAQIETVRAQQATVDIATKADDDGLITSPISGVITKRQVEPGQTVTIGQTLFEIVDPSQLEIQAKLPIEQQNALKVGNKIEFSLQGSNQLLTAVLTRVSPIADQVSRQVEFFAKPNVAINSLSIGAFVEGNILDSKQIQGQIIPLDSIQNIDSKPYVWVIRNQKIVKVEIQILDRQINKNVAVVSGLDPQDMISRVKFNSDDLNKSVRIANK